MPSDRPAHEDEVSPSQALSAGDARATVLPSRNGGRTNYPPVKHTLLQTPRPPAITTRRISVSAATSVAAASNVGLTLEVAGQKTTDPEDLRRHTLTRWLYNEKARKFLDFKYIPSAKSNDVEAELARRYVDFNPYALAEAASETLGAKCVKMNKICESKSVHSHIHRALF